ncbi:glycosyltransferase family 2 protein [Blastopirellula marina]|uniref:Glycosyltransferase family 2 protein n=1 Tax=Blastopirellula marina TaxID=124 RepID=A0A2S8FAE2_9BACT|nr:glycosyltransferase family 2 protein [Blastopirellula marina]PQO28894.1 glycosyltransferase family 2 protein [Blastopirellula marina]PTL42167.1 glycosyltransferase family 2 protein [Blastopirellula marina]
MAKTLSIVIPALNEEGAIGSTIERCLEAREAIKEQAGLDNVEILVVNDGSTDRTDEIARSFKDVSVITFPVNQGYGAAIKEGWNQSSGDYLAFLDADGTCDPLFFANLCSVVRAESADVALGSRMGPDSKMPKIRRLGNNIFACLLGMLSGRRITDTASGMRVVRRDSLRHLYPLPNGLHFTPAMSARALLNDLKVIEIPMAYEERIGDSKLHALRDGFRFLKAIWAGVLCYRPESILLAAMIGCLTLTGLMAMYPVEFYINNGRLEEWMIYRFCACHLLGSIAFMLFLSIGFLSRVADIGPRRAEAARFWPHLISQTLNVRVMAVAIFVQVGMATMFLIPGITDYLQTGHISLHWSRLLAGAFLLCTAASSGIFTFLGEVVTSWLGQHAGRFPAKVKTNTLTVVHAPESQRLAG